MLQVGVSFSDRFHITFGSTSQATAANCHIAASAYIEKELNQTGSLVQLAKVGHPQFVFLQMYKTPRVYPFPKTYTKLKF